MDVDEELRKRREAEAALDRELDDSRPRPRVVPARGHRIGHALPLAIVVAAIAGLAAYLLTSFVFKFGWSPDTSYPVAGLAIAAIAWGATGISRIRATARDRCYDAAIAVLVGTLAYNLVVFAADQIGATPLPMLSDLFDRPIVADLGDRPRGLTAMPRFHVVMTWGAVVACGAVALASLARIPLDRRAA